MGAEFMSEYGTRILFIGAHPDDIEIGCGGTAAKFAAGAHLIAFAVASKAANNGDLREHEAKQAAGKLGLTEANGNLFFGRIPESELMGKMGDLRAWMNEVSRQFQPNTVFVHRIDRHTDHEVVNKVATGCFLKHGFYEFFIPRTEPELPFAPNKFIDIEHYIETKVAMCGCHQSQLAKYISRDVIETTAHNFYLRCDALQSPEKKGFVEAFTTYRSLTPDGLHLDSATPLGYAMPSVVKAIELKSAVRPQHIQHSPSDTVEILIWFSRLLRKFRADRFVGRVRRRAALSYLTHLHEDVIHEMRKFALACEFCGPSSEWDTNSWAVIGPPAAGFCSACRKIFCCLAEVDDNQIHCCLKSINASTGTVETWARSEPASYRDESIVHPISQNTVWSALLGRNDGNQTWDLFNFFSSKDLSAYKNQFRTTRLDWQEHYKSVLVFPLRYTNPRGVTFFDTFGFLAWDSPKVDAFQGTPEIFEHIHNRDVYHDKARKCAMYQTGAAIADTLSMLLRPICICEPQNR
jgi:LmbE family N-acetylglucosaminyl deacetylase